MMDSPVDDKEMYTKHLEYIAPKKDLIPSNEKHWIRIMNTIDDILKNHKTYKSKMNYLDTLWYLYVTTNPKIPGLARVLSNAITKVERRK